jgi:hypothetical protein
MGIYDEALAKTLLNRSDLKAQEGLDDAFKIQVRGEGTVQRHKETLQKSLGHRTETKPVDKSKEREAEMLKNLQTLENLAKGQIPVETETPEQELDRVKRENGILRKMVQRRKSK